jgi:uncharacterized membrane protein YidH (DUF202 family)
MAGNPLNLGEQTHHDMENSSEAQEQQDKKEAKKGKKEIGFERVRLALERLQLAWLRTALTFVALGFTAYKFYHERVEVGESTLTYLNGRNIGLFLILLAFLGLGQSIFQHRRSYARLRNFYPELPYSVSLIQSYFILALSFILFLVVLFRF